jgi:hypothetical protein
MDINSPEFLPYVGIAEIENLPNVSGVYFVIHNNDEIVYIGQSSNIRSRWVNGHHKYNELIQLGGSLTIHYLPSDGRSLFVQESHYVNKFSPRMNSVTKYMPLPKRFNTLFILYANVSMLATGFIFLAAFTKNPDWITVGGLVFIASSFFYIGGSFAWWYARRALRAKIEKEKQ